MWQGIKSRLRGRSKTGGSGNGGEDDGRHQARIQRQAKEAEKTIAKTASRELLEWEQRQGYRRTSTLTMPAFPTSGSSSSQQMGQQQQQRVSTSHHRRSFSTAKTLAESEHPSPSLTMTKSLHDDQNVKALPPIISTSDQPSGNNGGGDNREQLLQEIEAIRKSIDQLRTTTPTLNIDICSADDLPQPPSAPAMTRAHTSSPTGGRQAPWLTPDRSPRPSSVFVGSSSTTLSSPGGLAGATTPDGSSRQRRKSVADLFEQDAPRPYVPLPVSPSPAKAVQSGPPQLPPVSGARHSTEGRGARPASPSQPLQPQASRRRTKSSATVATSQANSSQLPNFPRSTSFKSGLSAVGSHTHSPSPPPLPLDAQGKIAALRGGGGGGAASPAPVIPPPQLNPQSRPQQQRRQIIDTPQEARKRLSTAIGRAPRPGGVTPTKRHSMYSSGTGGGDSGCVAISGGGGVGGSTTALTMSELQDRHQAKLRELQAPANARVKEAAAIAEAKAEWGERLERERREQLAREEEKKRRAAIQAEAEERRMSVAGAGGGGGMTSSASGGGGFAALKSFRRRTMSAADVLQSATQASVASPQQQALVPEQDPTATQQQQQQRRPPLSPLNGAGTSSGPATRSMSTKRLDGAQRAREWRKSLVSLSAEQPVPELRVDEFGQQQHQRPNSSLGLAPPDHSQAQARPRATPLSRPAGDRTKSMYGRVPMAGVIAEADDEAGVAQLQQEQQQQRRLTATDLRRMREGAGQQGQRQQQQGQRPRSVLLA